MFIDEEAQVIETESSDENEKVEKKAELDEIYYKN
jgi:hypothetical protein